MNDENYTGMDLDSFLAKKCELQQEIESTRRQKEAQHQVWQPEDVSEASDWMNEALRRAAELRKGIEASPSSGRPQLQSLRRLADAAASLVAVLPDSPEVAASFRQRQGLITEHCDRAESAFSLSRPTLVAAGQAPAREPTDTTFWETIRNHGLNFEGFRRYLQGEVEAANCDERQSRQGSCVPFPGVEAYHRLRKAAEEYLEVHCGLIEQQKSVFGLECGTIVYMKKLAAQLNAQVSAKPEAQRPNFSDLVAVKINCPCLIELIWSYWLEEGMLVQSMNAMALRFQNRRVPGLRDGMSRLQVDPLRPLNPILWGYIQDEQHRLSIARRAYEYDHHYGITIRGKAVPRLHSADSRSKFLEAFHGLLHAAHTFYKQRDNLMVVADAFPVLNTLREVHQLLTDGGDNQWGDLPWTARLEMLMQQWILARPEMKEIFRRRPATLYDEEWMGTVDAIKTAQGWTDTSITHFYRLATFGERILLSVRFYPWGDKDATREQAFDWADYWRAEVQGYMHSYRAVTGVDLSAGINATPPSALIRARLRAVSA